MKNETPSVGNRGVGRRGPGRPRDPSVDSRLLVAAQRLLIEGGYSRLSLEDIADVAGVSRPTLYRRYRSKVDLVSAALAQLPALQWQPPEGEAKDQIAWALRLFAEFETRVDPWSLLGVVLSEERRHPDWLDSVRKRLILPRRQFLKEILQRGVDSGQVRTDADLDLAVDLLTGPAFIRRVATGTMPADWPTALVDTVWRLFAADREAA